jgi:hypothetical protein
MVHYAAARSSCSRRNRSKERPQHRAIPTLLGWKGTDMPAGAYHARRPVVLLSYSLDDAVRQLGRLDDSVTYREWFKLVAQGLLISTAITGSGLIFFWLLMA